MAHLFALRKVAGMSTEHPVPTCECHGEPTVSNGHGRRQCRVKRAEVYRRYDRSPKGRAKNARSNARRVIIGQCSNGGYFGRHNNAAEINARGRALLAGFIDKQKEARVAAGS